MDIREAILKTADHIEANPAQMNWGGGVFFPGMRDDDPICPLCWIGKNMQPEEIIEHHVVSRELLGIHHDEFYGRCSALIGIGGMGIIHRAACDWARALRLYADKWHPARPVQQPPNWRAMASGSVPADAISEDARV